MSECSLLYSGNSAESLKNFFGTMWFRQYGGTQLVYIQFVSESRREIYPIPLFFFLIDDANEWLRNLVGRYYVLSRPFGMVY